MLYSFGAEMGFCTKQFGFPFSIGIGVLGLRDHGSLSVSISETLFLSLECSFFYHRRLVILCFHIDVKEYCLSVSFLESLFFRLE